VLSVWSSPPTDRSLSHQSGAIPHGERTGYTLIGQRWWAPRADRPL